MNYAIIGSRNFNDYEMLKIVCGKLIKNTDAVVSGGANGADILGKQYAIEHALQYIEFLPDWEAYGKRAGFMRNHDIIDNSDFIIAFWDGKSNGTAHSIELARNSKKPTLIVYL